MLQKVYKNTSRPRGMVFLANYTFPVGGRSSKDYRKGSEVDEENIKNLFEGMGYTVKVHRNLTRVVSVSSWTLEPTNGL